ncbi:MAG: ADOP family duplicated permease [Terriglobales bacterium]
MLEARGLTKHYSYLTAVRQVSFSIKPGEILGYLGPNGAGKSTTVKMLTGLIEPSEGQIVYKGHSIYDDLAGFQSVIGYVPEEAHLYPHLSGREYLQLVGRLRGMPRRTLEPKMDELLHLFSLWDDRFTTLSSYSKGMRQKILLSAALMHTPEILILDEPFSGLDVTSALMLRRLLSALARRGKMIFYSSHVLEVVEKVCSQVLILRHGEVVAYDSINRLRELMQQPSLEGVFAQLTQVDDGAELADRILEVVSSKSEMYVLPHDLDCGGTGASPQSSEPERASKPSIRLSVESAPDLEPAQLDQSRPIDWFRGARQVFRDLNLDVRYASRVLRASPGFTLVTTLSLALGICIASCAFSEMNGIVLRSLPAVDKPEELVSLQLPVSYPEYRRYSQQNDVIVGTMAYIAPVPFTISAGDQSQRIWGQLVSDSYFATLGVTPFLGNFIHEDDASTSTPVVISYRLWHDRFGSDRSILGKVLRIDSQLVKVVAVGPRDFFGASPLLFASDLWMPISVGGATTPELAGDALERRDRTMFRVVARLKPGVGIEQAEAALDAKASQFERDNGQFDDSQKGRRVLLVEGGKLLPLRKQDLPFFTSFLTVLAGLVMLIACANVANIMLARANRRRKEIAVRMALGASRLRIIRQLLTESMMIAVAAAIPAFLGCMWLMHLLSRLQMPFLIPVSFDFQPDGRVLMLTMFLTITTGLAFGMVPALQAARRNVAPALKDSGDAPLYRLRALSARNLLMVSQLAGSLTLLVVLAVLAIGIQTTIGIKQGFDPDHLYLASIDVSRDGYTPEQSSAFYSDLLNRIQRQPSVEAASLTESVPVSLADGRVALAQAGEDHRSLNAVKHIVGKDYFETAGIRLLVGRVFQKADEEKDTKAVIVSSELARELWGTEGPLGHAIEVGNDQIAPAKILPGSYDYRASSSPKQPQTLVVIGVVPDLAEGLIQQKPVPAIYFPLRQGEYMRPPIQGITLLVRSRAGTDVPAMLRREVADIDPNITVFDLRSMQEQIGRFMSSLRIAAWTYAIVGVFGLVLAIIGLAGITAYSVVQRTREIAIRVALGATGRRVLVLIMREALVLTAFGTLAGMAGAWSAAKFLSAMNSAVGQVTATSSTSPVVLFGASFLLAALALLACYLPARKSLSIDPAIALRYE